MFASTLRSRIQRRGVVLVVVLGMLGLLALIGVTFATFSNQAQINARNFSQAAQFPDATEMMDYALSQLIDDTANPASVIRGHSLKRDMYGNDAANNGYLAGLPDGTSLVIQKATLITTGKYAGMIQCVTNIPSANNLPAGAFFYPYDFTRWIIRYPAATDQNYASVANPETYVSRTHEILFDDATSDPNARIFYIAAPTQFVQTRIPQSPPSTPLPKSPPNDPVITGYRSPDLPALTGNKVWTSTLTTLPPAVPSSSTLPAFTQNFVLDGRYLRAFNGPGVAGLRSLVVNGTSANGLDTALLADSYTGTLPIAHPLVEYANFRYNGNIFRNVVSGYQYKAGVITSYTPSYLPAYGDPNDSGFIPAMDEDYDAADLENWFLSIQSADGQVVIPSFHRPGILTPFDWTRTVANAGTDQAEQLKATRSMSRILRPRAADNNSSISFPDLVPDATGKITYDIDNDGDGVTDSVWLDLGYPPKRSPEGQLFKPLFSFLVVGLNGRLPLNTAGNVQGRDNALGSTFKHAEHLGNSPSEIDLKFALQNAWDPNFDPSVVPNPPYMQVDNVGIDVSVTQSRNVLTGTRPYDPDNNGDLNWVLVNNQKVFLPNNVADSGDSIAGGPPYYVNRVNAPVAGRFGEEDAVPTALPAASAAPTIPGPFVTPVGPGQSVVGGTAFDARDDNNNTFDFNGESVDLFDGSGQITVPAERIRRFVTPIDISGNGQVITFNGYTYNAMDPGASTTTANGADIFGRVSFFRYFRPPGVPIATTYSPGFAGTDVTPGTISIAAGPIYSGNRPVYNNTSNNPYHAYVAAVNPAGPAPSATTALALAGMPSNLDTSGTQVGVYSGGVAPTPPTNPASTYNYYVNSQFNSQGLNEADEVNLYQPSRLDTPFGPGDLQWLYRLQDVDGASLHSRLAQLAPISFLNPRDGARRRRLFALDSWETTNFVWANDNPQGVFPNNSRFTGVGNASFYNLNGSAANVTPVPDPAADFSILSNSGSRNFVSTPSIAHRDRKINLNFPLPVSNSPIEPIRQKWIRETYQLLKAVLPPKAVDTPEELAQLSQFLVNVIDYRDPDCTMTKFVNTDIIVNEPNDATATTQATLAFATANPPNIAYDVNYNPAASPTPPGVGANPAVHYLVQYGMEYQPVAINEVLAYEFQYKKTHATSASTDNDTPQMFVEVVNMLTQSAAAGSPDASDLDLQNWDFVVLPDDAQGRPDPYTGQIPLVQSGVAFQPATAGAVGVPLAGGTYGSTIAAPTDSVNPIPSALTSATTADNPATGRAYYYVFGNEPIPAASPDDKKTPTTSAGTTIPAATTTNTSSYVDITGMLYQRKSTPPATFPLPPTELNPGYYYWLYLRRPANPFDPASEKVVVDSFRFAFLKSKGKAYSNDTVTPKADQYDTDPTGEYLFSLQRMQPYRGGHAIPPLTTAGAGATAIDPTATPLIPCYGYSEQTFPGPTGTNAYIYYGDSKDYTSPSTPLKVTGEIRHTLGKVNSSTFGGTAPEPRDYFPFNDRDFTSVVELMMVPSCPPALFTKQFAEVTPPVQNLANQELKAVIYPIPTAPVTGGTVGPLTTETTVWATSALDQANVPPAFSGNGIPHTFPYLNDEFFYTAASEPPDNLTVIPKIAGRWITTEPSTAPFNVYNRSSTVDNAGINRYIGGPGGAGWFKMLDFFEVPSPAFGAIGPVAQGTNYDWARQDLRPGLLNLNLIIDEEVFLGLMGESIYRRMNQGQIGMPGSATFANATTPLAVTMVDEAGKPYQDPADPNRLGFYNIPNVGYFDPTGFTDPKDRNPYPGTTTTQNALMKACFADFLSLRHGGTGYLFAFGNGDTGSVAPVAAERPFHSLSYPDIDYTVLRPAALPPSANTVPSPNPSPGIGRFTTYPLGTLGGNYTGDPGVKNPYLFAQTTPTQPPPIPARRLFQYPDAWGGLDGLTFPAGGANPSNASPAGDPNVNLQVAQKTGLTMGGVAMGNNTGGLTNNGFYYPDLTDPPNLDLTTTPANFTTTSIRNSQYLGAKNYGGAGAPYDQREHPYFRTEWLQKVTNLTTVRTHQYAVWITVGFFEVTKQGNPAMASVDYSQAYDQLGLELGVLDGKNTRYRGFFLVDRTKAVGFNVSLPGDFRNCVVYRDLIE